MAAPWDDDSEQTSFFHEEAPSSPTSDGFQNSDNLANVQQWPADEWCFSADDECQSTELWIEVATTEQPLIADGPPNVVQEDVIVDWWEGYEDPNVPDFEWSGPIQPNAPPADQPTADSWDWDDLALDDALEADQPLISDASQPQDPDWQDEDSEDPWFSDDVLGADVIPAAAIVVDDPWSFEADYVEPTATAEGFQNSDTPADLAQPDSWDWSEDADDGLVDLDAPLSADTIAPTDLVSPDAWTWDDDVPDETPDEAVLGSDNTAVAAAQPQDPDWSEEDGSEDYELQIEDFANFELDPPQPDGWDWDSEAVEDTLDADQAIGADFVPPPSQPQDVDWDFTESADDDWTFDDAQQSPPVITADQHFGDDAENWDDSTVDESDGTRPDDYALVDQVTQPVQIFDDPWDWNEDSDAELLGFDAQTPADVIPPSDLAQPDGYDWDEDATESADEFSGPVADDAQFTDDTWDWSEDASESTDELSAPVIGDDQFLDDAWEWFWGAEFAEVEDQLDSTLSPDAPTVFTQPPGEVIPVPLSDMRITVVADDRRITIADDDRRIYPTGLKLNG